jgi:addiction module HigA family antidote
VGQAGSLRRLATRLERRLPTGAQLDKLPHKCRLSLGQISINKLARPNRIGAIVDGTRSITADMALRVGTYFRVSPETWLGLQIDYDLRLIARKGRPRDRRALVGQALWPANYPAFRSRSRA